MQMTLPVQLPVDETFENYIAERANQSAVVHLESICDSERVPPTITLIQGVEGTGKTHLLYSICHSAEHHNIPCAFINCQEVENLSWHIFESLESMPVICLDNIHAIAGNNVWEVALFDLINRIIEQKNEGSNTCLIMSCQSHSIKTLFELPDLISRLNWGIGFSLVPASDETKRAIVKRRIAQRGLTISAANLNYLLVHGARDTHSLMKVLSVLDDLSLQTKKKISLAMLKEAIKASQT